MCPIIDQSLIWQLIRFDIYHFTCINWRFCLVFCVNLINGPLACVGKLFVTIFTKYTVYLPKNTVSTIKNDLLHHFECILPHFYKKNRIFIIQNELLHLFWVYLRYWIDTTNFTILHIFFNFYKYCVQSLTNQWSDSWLDLTFIISLVSIDVFAYLMKCLLSRVLL